MVGKGKNSIKKVTKNHLKLSGLSKSSVKRLARKGGVKRLSKLIYTEVSDALKVFLKPIIRDAISYMDSGDRKTVVAKDIIYALENNGKPIYIRDS